ncbi:3'-5' exonuclease [Lachnospira multipara]|uniref:3'-5' exonuclease n=1 Tax=Lachnospira multipara TaxID=28051 RepID=UPI000486C69E|nr:3'-5' exonuclease [Lachnospira multipara]
MKHIFIDLEMNNVAKEHKEFKRISRQETIEIGAVRLDENLEVVDEFKEYVKPQYNSIIEPKFVQLTGITTVDVSGADHFANVLKRFINWCGHDYKIYSWSDCDKLQLQNEIKAKKLTEFESDEGLKYMYDNWIDYQNEFKKELHLSHILSLSKAVDLSGLAFQGKAHDGLTDARNTALLFKASRNSKEYEKMRKAFVEALTPTVFTMADLIDFSQLKLSDDKEQ